MLKKIKYPNLVLCLMVIFRLEIGLNQQLSLKNQYSPLLTLSDFWGVIVDFDPMSSVLCLLLCTFDSDFRNLNNFPTLKKYQVLGTILFFQFCNHYFFQVCRPIFLYAKKMEIQVLDRNTMCIWSRNMMKQSVLSLGIHNLIYMKWIAQNKYG